MDKSHILTKAQRAETTIDSVMVRAIGDSKNREVELAFSSELPYEREWGMEILDHSNVDLSRLLNGAPLLADHNTSDQIGVVESVRIDDDKVGRAIVRFSKSTRGEEFYQDVVDGIRRKVSVGYRILDLETVGEIDDVPAYKVQWAPYEISIVSVPADDTVGVGRSDENSQEKIMANIADQFVTDAAEDLDNTPVVENEVRVDDTGPEVIVPVKSEDEVRAEVELEVRASIEAETLKATEAKAAADKAEATRTDAIKALGVEHKQSTLMQKSIDEGHTVAEATDLVLNTYTIMENTKMDNTKTNPEIGLTTKEIDQFSFVKAARALANPGNVKLREDAAFEFDVSFAAADLYGKEARGLWIPSEVRAASVGTSTAGGNLVDTDLLAGSFIDHLRNASVMMGKVTLLDGLVGKVDVPRQTSDITMGWVAEDGDVAESTPAFDHVTLSPKTVGARSKMTRLAMIQTTPSIEALVRRNLAVQMALAIDFGILKGTGSSNQPTGILNAAGTSVLSNGTRTNGLALSWEDISYLVEAVESANADMGNLGFVFNSKTSGKAMRTQQFSSSNGMSILDAWKGLGYDMSKSNQLASNLTKGTGSNLSEIIFGNYSDVFVGMWSGMDMVVDSITSNAGATTIKVYQDVDVAIGHGASFAIAKDIITV